MQFSMLPRRAPPEDHKHFIVYDFNPFNVKELVKGLGTGLKGEGKGKGKGKQRERENVEFPPNSRMRTQSIPLKMMMTTTMG
jgi:hypothetical protein